MAWGAGLGRHMPHCSAGPSPRIFIYDIPRSLLSRPTLWRLVYGVGAWIRKSPHWERHGDCADYFFVPMHPENMVNGRMMGNASFAREVDDGRPTRTDVGGSSPYTALVSFRANEFLAVAAVGHDGQASLASGWGAMPPAHPGQPNLIGK